MIAGLLQDSLEGEGFTIEVAHSAAEAVVITKRFDPDIAILDINLGRGASGIDLAYILSKQHPGLAILFLTQHPDLRTAGFNESDLPENSGYLRKSTVLGKSEVLAAIEEIVTRLKFEDIAHQDPQRPLANLTSTQIKVLRMVAQGYTNEEIAKRRNTPTRAVEHVLGAVFNSLGIYGEDGVNLRVEAVRLFISAAGTPDRE